MNAALCYIQISFMTSLSNKPRRKHSFLGAFLSGVALPAEVETRHSFRHLTGSDLDRIRGDVVRVGETFKLVIDRENGNQKDANRAFFTEAI